MNKALLLIIIAQIFGALLFISDMVCTQQKTRKNILKFNTISNVLSILQYMCLGAYSGAVCCLIALGRNLVFPKFKKVPTYILGIYLFLAIALNIPNMTRLINIIPIINICIYGIAISQDSVKSVKIVEIITGFTSVFYNLISLAIVSAFTATIFTGSAIVGYMHYSKDKKEDESNLKLELI